MRLLITAISSIFILYALLGGNFPMGAQYALVFVLVGVIGMAHGSIDHIIASDVLRIVPKNRKLVFIAVYLLIIALYVLLWFISPLASFILFIVYSAFHFGQADTLIISKHLDKTQSAVLGLSYGLLILSALIVFHGDYTAEICPDWFLQILPSEVLLKTSTWIFYLSFAFLFVQNVLYTALRKISFKNNVLFISQLAFVLVIFKVLPALVAFSLYFGLWHALMVLKKEFKEVSQIRLINNTKDFIKALAPFTLVSLAGILVVIYFGSSTAHFTTIVAISVLAFPHTILMHLLYSKKESLQ